MNTESTEVKIDQDALLRPESTAQASGMGIPQEGDPPIPQAPVPPAAPNITEEGTFNPDNLNLPNVDVNEMAGVPKDNSEVPNDQSIAEKQTTQPKESSETPPQSTESTPNVRQDKGSSDGDQVQPSSSRQEALQGFVVDALSKHLGREVEPIEGLTEENFLEKVKPLLNDQPQLHPEVAKMQQALDAGSDFNEVLDAYQSVKSIDSMDDRELVAWQMKSQYGKTSEEDVHGLSEDDIIDDVNSMSDREVKKEAIRIRRESKAQQVDPMAKLSQEQEQRRAEHNAKLISEYDAEIDGVIGNVVTDNKVYGLELEQSELSRVIQDAKVGMRPDPKTGVSEFVNELKDNESFAKLALLYYAAKEGQINANITRAKEKVKSNYLDLLDDTPRQNRNVGDGGEGANTGKIDLEALRRPEKQLPIQ